MNKLSSGGGWPAVRYSLDMARKSGGLVKFYRALATKNACKACALGMGGQRGGMVDELGHSPEVCKKSMQAMAADMRPAIPHEFFEHNTFEDLRQMTSRELEGVGRLTHPLYAGPDDERYAIISWDRALTACIAHLKSTEPDRNFFYVSGRSSNEAGFLLQLFARLYGTNNVNNCSFYCHSASGVGLSSVTGRGTGTIILEDLNQCDLVFLIGGNPASNHPRLMRRLAQVRDRGGRVIVINPMVETGLVNFRIPSSVRSMLLGSEIASKYVQPHIGGDIALLTGIAKRIDELGATDTGFAREFAEGYDEYRHSIRAADWEDIETRSGVDRGTIYYVAQLYAESQAAVFAWTMGITHHSFGVDNVRAIANLALLRGMVGRRGAGLMPIRGHSNVQGIGSVGVTPKLKEPIRIGIEEYFGVKLPTTPGLDTLDCIEAMQEGKLNAGWCLGGNLYGSNPDAARTVAAFERLESLVYLSTALNTGHAWGRGQHTLILPVRVRDEESQPTTQESMFNYVRLSDGGPARLDGPRSEVEIIADIAHGVLGHDDSVDWRALAEHRNIRRAIAAVVPGYEKIGRIDETKEEFQIGGRTFHEPAFATPSGKARFHVVALPDNGVRGSELRLMTVRSEGQFNTVVYEDEDIYRHQERRDVILMNEEDIQRLGLQPDQRVTVRSRVGAMHDILVRPFAIRAGNAAMYYPEANALVPRLSDRASGTPAFKFVPIEVNGEKECQDQDEFSGAKQSS